MQASFTACAGGGVHSPMEINSIILSKCTYYHYNYYVSDCLVLVFGFVLCVIRNTQLMYVLFNASFLPVKIAFVPPWKEFLIESCHVTHLLILNLIVLLSAEPVLRHDTYTHLS